MTERQLLTIDPETVTIENRGLEIISARDRGGGMWALHLSARHIIVFRQWDIKKPVIKLELLIGNLGMVDVTKAQQALNIERARYPGREFCLGVAVSIDPSNPGTGKILYDNTDLGVWTRVPAVPVLGSGAQVEIMGGGHA